MSQLSICHQMAGGIPKETRDAWPMLPRLFTGTCFPAGICFIVFLGGELFTGVSFEAVLIICEIHFCAL
jgi:formate/nitrite transporter FocA (FNT family)